MEPKIIFEDKDLLVIDKPAGMVVNRAETTREGETVQDWLARNFQFPISSDQLFRNGIVHRLDKETSGLLLVGKSPQAFANLQAQFKNRQVKKRYLALVHGRVVPEEGEIRAPVGRLPWNRERFGVVPGGREAETKYKVLSIKYKVSGKTSEPFSLLELSPLTGRTHQIRVHLKYLGYPIVGDIFYAGRKRGKEDREFCPRVFLHASFLQFTHPVSGEKLEFKSDLPEDLNKVLSLWKI